MQPHAQALPNPLVAKLAVVDIELARCECCFSIVCASATTKGQFQPITFDEAAACLTSSPHYPLFDIGSPPARKCSHQLEDGRWSLQTDGGEAIAYVWLEQGGRWVID